MEYDTRTPPYRTSDPTSFAYQSVRERWPFILTGAIEDVRTTTAVSNDKAQQEEGRLIEYELAKLKDEVQHDTELTPILDDGQPGIAAYNIELQTLGPPTWFNVSWLFGECYLYRRMSTFFSLSKYWKTYDVFARQKMSTFKSSRPAVLELAAKYKELALQLEPQSASDTKPPEELEQAQRLLFIEMCKICLWGNATDLSLLTSLTYEDLQKLQGSEARKSSEKNILVNDLPAAYEILKAAQKSSGNKERRVGIILDNAGFELFVDLMLASYLVFAGLATAVVLHPKTIPWFVSDALPRDITLLLDALANPQTLYAQGPDVDQQSGRGHNPLSEEEEGTLSFLHQHWGKMRRDGQLAVRPSIFWNQAGSYWRLPNAEPQLFEYLKESELVIFKGDLNYRKLTGDAMWPTETPFETAIGPMGHGSGIRTLALRTCKADAVVGLPKDERLKATEGGLGGADSGARKWAWSGKWAVVQLCDGKTENI